MSTHKSEIRAAEYRARADAASAAARDCLLDRPREQHELAAATWTQMAEAEERRARDARLVRGPAEGAGAPQAPDPSKLP